MFTKQRIQVRCPNCGTSFVAEVHNIIDVGEEPALKQQFLAGRLNSATCPSCGTSIALATPLLYHDPAKEFVGVFIPAQSNLSEPERQKRIGDLTNLLMTRLPPERRRAYLLQPRQFLTLQSMMEAILEADGITREMMEAQRQRLSLLQQLMQAAANPERLRALVTEYDEKLDEEFFELAAAVAENMAAEGDERTAQQIMGFIQTLMGMSSLGRKIQAQQKILAGLNEHTTREDILERLIQAEEDAAIEALVAVARPLMDYPFFLLLSQRIEQAEKRKERAEAQRLRALRDRVLELQRKQDEAARAIMEEATQLLKAVLDSDNPVAVLRAHKAEIGEPFLALLMANIESARRQGAVAAARRLTEIWKMALEILEEDLPADLRLINRLLREESPERTRQLLMENRSELDQELVESMRVMAEGLRAQGQEEMAKRLENIRAQALLML
jgi:ribosomal protein S27AE